MLVVGALAAGNAWLVARQRQYRDETTRLRTRTSDVERRTSDAVLTAQAHRLEVTLELLRRQARLAPELHLSIAVDSGRMYLLQRGAVLREMAVDVGGDRTVGTPPDTVRARVPRGQRAIERVLGPDDPWEIPGWVYAERRRVAPAARAVRGALGPVALVLGGGTVIYTLPAAGPLSDTAYVLPGAVRARAADLAAILPNLARGTPVYLY